MQATCSSSQSPLGASLQTGTHSVYATCQHVQCLYPQPTVRTSSTSCMPTATSATINHTSCTAGWHRYSHKQTYCSHTRTRGLNTWPSTSATINPRSCSQTAQQGYNVPAWKFAEMLCSIISQENLTNFGTTCRPSPQGPALFSTHMTCDLGPVAVALHEFSVYNPPTRQLGQGNSN
jgi:hypothetical protein